MNSVFRGQHNLRGTSRNPYKRKKKNQWLNWKSHELQAHISLSGPGFCSLSNCPFQFWIKTPQTPRHGRRYSRSNIKDERKKKGSLTWSISLSAFLPFFYFQTIFPGFPGGTSDKETTCQCRRHKRRGFDPWVRKIPLKRAWQPTAVFLPRESNGQRSVAGYGPWGRKEPDSTHAHHLLTPYFLVSSN